jgi:hypothetical protein
MVRTGLGRGLGRGRIRGMGGGAHWCWEAYVHPVTLRRSPQEPSPTRVTEPTLSSHDQWQHQGAIVG